MLACAAASFLNKRKQHDCNWNTDVLLGAGRALQPYSLSHRSQVYKFVKHLQKSCLSWSEQQERLTSKLTACSCGPRVSANWPSHSQYLLAGKWAHCSSHQAQPVTWSINTNQLDSITSQRTRVLPTWRCYLAVLWAYYLTHSELSDWITVQWYQEEKSKNWQQDEALQDDQVLL